MSRRVDYLRVVFLMLLVAVSSLAFAQSSDSSFTTVTTLAGGKTTPPLLHRPAGVAVDPDSGNVYLSDTKNHQIKVLTPTGEMTVLAGSGVPGLADGSGLSASFHEPAGLAFDRAGRALYVADRHNHVIRRVTLDGAVSGVAGTGKRGFVNAASHVAQFDEPSAVAFGDDGSIYVADSRNNAVRRIGIHGGVTTVAGSGRAGFSDGAASSARFASPEGIAVRADGALVIADAGNHAIRLIVAGGVTTIAGTGNAGSADGPALSATFREPRGLALGDDGSVFITDAGNGLIRALRDGAVSTIAGAAERRNVTQLVDGSVDAATFNEPSAITFAGALYIADSRHNAIRMILPVLQLVRVRPARGPLAGGTTVRVEGSGFIGGRTAVFFGTEQVTATYVRSTELQVTAPPGSGTVDVIVSSVNGTATAREAFTYVPPPSILSVVPRKGPSSGGTATTISGSNFLPGDTEFLFGGARALDPLVRDSATASVITPAGAPGTADVVVRTVGGEATLAAGFQFFAPPVLVGFAPPSGKPGVNVTILGEHFDPEAPGNVVRFGGVSAAVIAATPTSIATVVPPNATTGRLSVTTAGGTAHSATDFVVPVLASISVTPAAVTLNVGETLQLHVTGTYTDGHTGELTSLVSWGTSNPLAVSVNAIGVVSALGSGQSTITAGFEGVSGTAIVQVQQSEPLPPEPATVAPPTDRTIAQPFGDTIRFLYSGDNPIQTGVGAGAIEPRRAAVVRGRVLTHAGFPLGGATVTIAGHPELGSTLSRADGMYDLAVNGGGHLIVRYEKSGHLPVERQPYVGWNEFAPVPDVVLTPLDTAVTTVVANASVLQTARGSRVNDGDGSRQATVLFPAGTGVTLVMPDGSTRTVDALSVRATEYTVGTNGAKAMPAELPPTSAYTYCIELSADEALAAGAAEVRFSKPLALYVENFLGFPVGGIVPVGYYDRMRGAWIPSDNGRVIRITSTSGGSAQIDTNGDGSPDTGLDINDAERRQLASLYTAGQTLWRVPLAHFTPWDCNWPYGPPAGAEPPTLTPPGEDNPPSIAVKAPASEPNVDDPVVRCGSVIECENRGLGETAPLSGSPFSLHYRSHRTTGRSAAYEIDIELTGASLPPGLKSVEMEIFVAGQVVRKSFAPAPKLEYTFEWDARNAYAQAVEGSAHALINVGYTYQLVYQTPSAFAQSFARVSDTRGSLRPGRMDFTLWQTLQVNVLQPGAAALRGAWTNKAAGLGGWSLSAHHAYDPRFQILYKGTGEQRTAEAVISPFAGRIRTYGFSGDGGAAADAVLQEPEAVAASPDGSVYIADSLNFVVRRVDPSGRITTVAGIPGYWPPTGSPLIGDGGPATSAPLNYPWDLEVAPDGTLYIVEHAAIRTVNPSGVITTIAGTNQWSGGGEGDGGPATRAKISPVGMTLGRDGTLYFLDGYGIRQVRNGTITTLRRRRDHASGYAFFGHDLAIGDDGSLYCNGRTPDGTSGLLRLRPDGTISMAAPGAHPVSGIVAARDGSIYYSRRSGTYVERVTPDGDIAIVAGGGSNMDASGAPAAAGLSTSWLGRVAIAPDGALLIADGGNSIIRKIEPSLPGGALPDGHLVVSKDGSEVYRFNNEGRHLATLGRNGEPRLQFAYDAKGQLASITDADGNRTTIERDAEGLPLAIVAPGGQRTEIVVDPNGFLFSLSNGAGETRAYDHSATGLLLSYVDPRGMRHTYTYDEGGSLIKDTAPGGGETTLTQTVRGDELRTVLTTPEGRRETITIVKARSGELRRTVTDVSGLTAVTTVGTDGVTTASLPDGTTVTARETADPRYGMQAPVVAEQAIALPSGLVWRRTATRAATVADRTRPFSVISESDVWRVNGREYVGTYDAATRRGTVRTPAGRTTSMTFDSLGRVVRLELPGLAPAEASYASGLLTSISQGGRSITFTYNDRRELTAIRNMGREVGLRYDAGGNLVAETLPDGRVVAFEYDRAGNLTSLTPAGRPKHSFTYTALGSVETYAPPQLAGATATRYAYNRERQLTTITRPDGQSIGLSYDSAGRIAGISGTAEAYTFSYDATGRLSSEAHAGQQLTYSYDGPVVTAIVTAGVVAGHVAWSHNEDLWMTQESVNGSSVAFGYDADGLLTAAGALTITRDAANGLLTGASLGKVKDAWTYNDLGELVVYTASYESTPLAAFTYARDSSGRITSIGSRSFEYDAAGRLVRVTGGGAPIAEYDYDSNSNRTAHRHLGGSVEATYDDQDRLLTYGNATYEYTANGELKSRTEAGITATFEYDAFQNLRRVELPGRTIEYVIDARNRRVGKLVNGTTLQGWVYADQFRIVAEVDGTNAVLSRFVYGTRANVADYMIRDGVTYRIVSDHLGSPVLVVNVADGAIAQAIDYDEFGRVLRDTNPGFQPFGFAGGLYDRDTGLVRFGARDYDPETGRWTAKDPIGFAGGDTNLYGYTWNDPINWIDPSGLSGVCTLPGRVPPFTRVAPQAVRFRQNPGMPRTTPSPRLRPAPSNRRGQPPNPGSDPTELSPTRTLSRTQRFAKAAEGASRGVDKWNKFLEGFETLADLLSGVFPFLVSPEEVYEQFEKEEAAEFDWCDCSA